MKPLANVLRSAAVFLASLVLLSGCGGGDGGTSTVSSAGTGTLSLSITDQPACGYDHVFITVEKIRVHQSEAAADTDGGWHEIVLSPAKRIDLLTLTNGVLEILGQTVLPAGTYTQMRLVLASNSNVPKANTVVLTSSGNEVELTTPSGQQSGVKMNVKITVEPDKVADFVLDFDACKSIVKAGNSGQYLLKPVVTVIPVITEAGQRIIGYIDTTTLGATTLVSAQSGGIVVKATPPEANGRFVLYPVPPGNYDLVITSAGKATAVMTGVPVVTTAYTYVGSDSVRIALMGSNSHDVAGTVSVNGNPVSTGATVRAVQTLHNGPTVEVASMPVDASTGLFGFSLPVGAPQATSYAANPVSIAFAPDSADPLLTAAGKYTLEASIEGLPSQTAAINLLGGNVVTNFSFSKP
jgi:hypothetical protein